MRNRPDGPVSYSVRLVGVETTDCAPAGAATASRIVTAAARRVRERRMRKLSNTAGPPTLRHASARGEPIYRDAEAAQVNPASGQHVAGALHLHALHDRELAVDDGPCDPGRALGRSERVGRRRLVGEDLHLARPGQTPGVRLDVRAAARLAP